MQCDNLRMTAFEMASNLSRTNGGKNFKREVIKIAHNKAVELLVSYKLINAVFRELKTTGNPK